VAEERLPCDSALDTTTKKTTAAVMIAIAAVGE
jgi:hypothetical protein